MLAGADVEAVTRQGGVSRPVAPAAAALPPGVHAEPGRGAPERVPRPAHRGAGGGRAAAARWRRRTPHLLQVAEIRTIAADRLWLSGAYDRDVVGFHFTWVRDVPGVYAVLPAIEEALLPLGGRPHWGKCFAAEADALRPLYPRFEDFRDLVGRVDPARQVPQRLPGPSA